MEVILLLFSFLSVISFGQSAIVSSLGKTYEAEWESLDSRPLPSWYPGAKLGIFVHWGLYSVPSYGLGEEWFWQLWKDPGNNTNQVDKKEYMAEHFAPKFKYQDFLPEFKADLFDPVWWADLFKDAGARYVVLTAKHHDGYTMWPSPYAWNWNAVDTGPGRDLVGELADAVRNTTSLHFGLYNSLYEWYHPFFLEDRHAKYTSTKFVDDKLLPEIKEMVTRYKPEVVWSDGDWMAGADYWKSKELLAWLFSESPVKDTVVVNDRWGKRDTWCKHGSYFTCGDKQNPGVLKPYKWENAMTLDDTTWGYRRDSPLSHYLTMDQLLDRFISTISCGGNMLVNVGPTGDGRITPIQEERLRQLGDWLRCNGEAVYDSEPWTVAQRDAANRRVWYTTKGTNVYAFLLVWPEDDHIELAAPKPGPFTTVKMLGAEDFPVEWTERVGGGMSIKLPALNIANMPCEWAWTLRLTNLQH